MPGQIAIKIAENVDITVSKRELSAIMGLSKRRIEQLTKIKVLTQLPEKKYQLFMSLRAYMNYLRGLLKKYMRLYKVELTRAGRRSRYHNLAFYGDLSDTIHPFSHESLREIDDRLQVLFKIDRDKKRK